LARVSTPWLVWVRQSPPPRRAAESLIGPQVA